MSKRQRVREANVKTRARPIDGFTRGHGLARIIAAGIVIVPILAWFVFRDPGAVVNSHPTTGTVLEYRKPIALIALDNGDRARIYAGPTAAVPGQKLPLIADTHKDGSVQYRVDLKALAAAAPVK